MQRYAMQMNSQTEKLVKGIVSEFVYPTGAQK